MMSSAPGLSKTMKKKLKRKFMNDISLKKPPEASQKTLRRARHIAPVPLKHHLGPHMARQESQKEEEIRENSSNLRAHLAQAA